MTATKHAMTKRTRKARVWKMFALRGPRSDDWAFDVYHSEREARRVMAPGERIVPVLVTELRRKS